MIPISALWTVSSESGKRPSPPLGDPYVVHSNLIICVLAYFEAKDMKKKKIIKEILCNFLVRMLQCLQKNLSPMKT
jgi:hypothetical protein